ncbi:hypothetical protein NECID01_1520 [Nematocida sp. AWRm77]|nr:hypothetical protein NECID01_1520 [Nematocida sp. AWRm77]
MNCMHKKDKVKDKQGFFLFGTKLNVVILAVGVLSAILAEAGCTGRQRTDSHTEYVNQTTQRLVELSLEGHSPSELVCSSTDQYKYITNPTSGYNGETRYEHVRGGISNTPFDLEKFNIRPKSASNSDRNNNKPSSSANITTNPRNPDGRADRSTSVVEEKEETISMLEAIFYIPIIPFAVIYEMATSKKESKCSIM